MAVHVDVSDEESTKQMVAKTIERFGRVDVLINNASIFATVPMNRGLIEEISPEEWDKLMSVNLKGVFLCCRAVLPQMRQQKSGKIVNVASQNGVIGYYNRAAYCSSKAGVVNLTRVLAIEWASRNINVNAIGPTFVRTPLTEKLFQEESFKREILSRIPLGRLGKPEDVAGAVVFLSSPAADLITGHTLLVDGGWTAI
jgi:2-deoxy-D-gluconate 3-dehydrogenase